jgi:hypothetical protein
VALFEPLHAVTYFAPQARSAARLAGARAALTYLLPAGGTGVAETADLLAGVARGVGVGRRRWLP